MTERLLQFIWQFQYFNIQGLKTSYGEKLEVVYPGIYNHHQGPDFLAARVKIENRLWVGNIELHIQASDWEKHAHHTDRNYDNVILHVVWRDDGWHTVLPTLVLENRIPKLLLHQYQVWMKSSLFIPCQQYMGGVNETIWICWKERLLVERLQRKYSYIMGLLEQNNYHWEETYWWMLARNLGLYINAEAMEDIAKSFPYRLLSKHGDQIHQIEALLLGQAGLLEKAAKDPYVLMLQKEYQFLKHKYHLTPTVLPLHFLRMRPHAFPTLRLALLSNLVHTGKYRLKDVLEVEKVKELKSLFEITANDYWHYHFHLDELSGFRPKRLGIQMINSIIINTVIPVLFAYGHFYKKEKYWERALSWLGEIGAEQNGITLPFKKLGVENKKACDSQALIELKIQYCNYRRCLDCAIGNAILKRKL